MDGERGERRKGRDGGREKEDQGGKATMVLPA